MRMKQQMQAIDGGSRNLAEAPRYTRPACHAETFSTNIKELTMSRRKVVPPLTGLTPLAYLLSIIRDPGADSARRDRLACAALPYCHQRLAEKTKKVHEAEEAATA